MPTIKINKTKVGVIIEDGSSKIHFNQFATKIDNFHTTRLKILSDVIDNESQYIVEFVGNVILFDGVNISTPVVLQNRLSDVLHEKPDYIDITSETIIYEGYKTNTTDVRVTKVDLTTTVISRTYAIGAWADRATLTYK